MVLAKSCVFEKILCLEESCHRALVGPASSLETVPVNPGRDAQVIPLSAKTLRPGLSQKEGQLRLLHDLANIELQAMELGYRTLIEFPEANPVFRQQLAELTLEEGRHLRLCLEALQSLGGFWGQFPIHLGLWEAVSARDTLLERVFIVHRYLEGSGLDAGEGVLRRLSGIANKSLSQVVKTIVDDEERHVAFGSQWYFSLCKDQQMDPFEYYRLMTEVLLKKHPRKEALSWERRRLAGFEDREIQFLDDEKRKHRGLAPSIGLANP